MRRLLGLALVALAIGAGIAVLRSRRAPAPVQQVAAPEQSILEATTLEEREESRPPPSTGTGPVRTRPAPRKVAITFADGTTIPVELRPIRAIPPPFPVPERFADRYAELVSLAEQGDAGAARSLYKWLKICERAYGDEASLQRATARLHADRVMTYPDAVRPPMSLQVGVDVKEFERIELREPYEFCIGINSEQKEDLLHWLEVAVKAGDLQVVPEYAAHLGDTAEALKIWETLWQEQGYRGSLQPLAIMYSKGVAGGEPDYVRGYAYMLMELKLLEVAYSNSTSPHAPSLLGAVEESLRHTGGFLSPQQTAAAEALAKQLLAENPNCCSGSIFGVTR